MATQKRFIAKNGLDNNGNTLINVSGLSGTNTGDETAATIKTKLGITTLSGSNTGDQVIPYDLHNFINGKPLVNEVLMRSIAVRAFKIPLNFAGSYAYCTTPATSSFTIELLKNNVRVGTIIFAPGATTGTFALATEVTFNISDQVALRCVNAEQDPTLSDVVISILGSLI